jgi:hypothetical protein
MEIIPKEIRKIILNQKNSISIQMRAKQGYLQK